MCESPSLPFTYLLISRHQEESWSSNANAFIAEEDDETAIMSLRITGFDLLQVRALRHLMKPREGRAFPAEHARC